MLARVAFSGICTVDISETAVGSAVERALAAVDAVHEVPADAPPVLIQLDHDLEDPGAYEVEDPNGIFLNPETSDPAFTTLHEIGHYLDHRVLGVPPVWATYTDELKEWWEAVENSGTYRELGEMYWTPKEVVLAPGVVLSSDPDDLDYFREVEELFARSYAQHVATRSGAPELLEELSNAPKVPYPEQWEEDDFRPIADTLDRLLEGRGWSK